MAHKKRTPWRVLLIDRERQNAVQLRDALKQAFGEDTVLAARGTMQDGLFAAWTGEYDICLFSCMLPCGGVNQISRFHDQHPSMPVVAVGPVDGQLMGRARAAGADAFMFNGKVEPRELRRVISRAVTTGRHERFVC